MTIYDSLSSLTIIIISQFSLSLTLSKSNKRGRTEEIIATKVIFNRIQVKSYRFNTSTRPPSSSHSLASTPSKAKRPKHHHTSRLSFAQPFLTHDTVIPFYALSKAKKLNRLYLLRHFTLPTNIPLIIKY